MAFPLEIELKRVDFEIDKKDEYEDGFEGFEIDKKDECEDGFEESLTPRVELGFGNPVTVTCLR